VDDEREDVTHKQTELKRIIFLLLVYFLGVFSHYFYHWTTMRGGMSVVSSSCVGSDNVTLEIEIGGKRVEMSRIYNIPVCYQTDIGEANNSILLSIDMSHTSTRGSVMKYLARERWRLGVSVRVDRLSLEQ
jgi:hypothetical protein